MSPSQPQQRSPSRVNMIRPSQLVLLRLLAISSLIFSSGCGAKSLQTVFAPDPQLKSPIAVGTKSPPTTALPADFPLYPQAQLQSTTQTPEGATVTTWTTPDPIDFVYAFYQKELTAKQWQIGTQPSDSDPQLTANQASLSVAISPQTTTDKQQPGVTFYQISLQGATTAPTATPTPTSTSEPTTTPTATPTPTPSPKSTSSLPATTAEYLTDLTKLGVLASTDTNSAGTTAPANRVVTRREYARWLVAANNKINGTKPSQQIKLAPTDVKPAFQDVPSSNPDFPSIQGLAEAGIVPSPLSGDATSVLFRPDAPLTREQLILWKVPLDTRQPLPASSLDTVKQTWGFQDAGKIDPKALRAVIADFQNGEQANIRRVFGYTTLFQPKKTVNLGEVAIAIWYFGSNSEGLSAHDAGSN